MKAEAKKAAQEKRDAALEAAMQDTNRVIKSNLRGKASDDAVEVPGRPGITITEALSFCDSCGNMDRLITVHRPGVKLLTLCGCCWAAEAAAMYEVTGEWEEV